MAQTQFRSDDTTRWWLGYGDGSDGAYSSSGNATDAPIDSSCSGTSGTTSLSATNVSFVNGEPVFIHQTRGTGAGNWELNQIASYSAGTITTRTPLKNTYTDSGASQAQVIQLKQYSSFTQNSGHTLTAKAWNGDVGGFIAFLCRGKVTIAGTLNLSLKGFVGGAGTNGNNGYAGESYVGATVLQTAANGGGGGGGDDLDKVNGGGGGYITGGAQDANASAPGTGSLVTEFYLGSGGGGGGHPTTAGAGGTGAGSLLIIADDIEITGSVTLNGGSSSGGVYGVGGGASGGGVLLKGKTIVLGSGLITASGGTSASNIDGNNGGTGGNGSVGRIHVDYLLSLTGTTTPTLDSTQDLTLRKPLNRRIVI